MTSTEPNTREANKSAIRRLYEECMNEGQLDSIDELVSPRFSNPDQHFGQGPEALKRQITSIRQAFPDIRFMLHEIVAEGSVVAVRWTGKGTHDGTFMNIPATHKPITQEGFVMYHFENGKIVELKRLVDRFGLLQQIGGLANR